jgi:uncharacterized protein
MGADQSHSGSLSSPSGPVSYSERISSLDIIRGIALLGILMINIEIFSTPTQFMVNPTLAEDFEGSNRIVWFIKQYLFIGKMWSLFSMLFGAGAYLLITRAEAKGHGAEIADIYYRRLIILLLLGLIHAYLIWSGDILYLYALVGLFLYPLRKLSVRWMIGLTLILFVINMSLYLITYRSDIRENKEIQNIEAVLESGEELGEKQQTQLEEWKERESISRPDSASMAEEIAIMSEGTYFEVRMKEKEWVHYFHTELIYNRVFLMTLVMMILGMALMKSGILSASWSKGFYLRMILIGYPIGFYLVYLRTRQMFQRDFDLLSFDLDRILHYLERLAITMGHLGLICILVKSTTLRWLKRSLAAVGRMTFTNYIFHSIICSLIFFGYGWGMFGKMDLTAQLWVVGSIWIFQMIASPIWLRYFHFGPLEWLWRSLTYLKKQPFRNF